MRPYHVAGVVLSSALLAAPAFAASPKSDVAAQPQRVSTGIVAPVLADPAGIRIPADVIGQNPGGLAKVVLSLNVDEKGNAQNVRVVKSASPALDYRVVQAVMQSHFQPATLNKHAIPVDMALTINVQR